MNTIIKNAARMGALVAINYLRDNPEVLERAKDNTLKAISSAVESSKDTLEKEGEKVKVVYSSHKEENKQTRRLLAVGAGALIVGAVLLLRHRADQSDDE